MNKMLSIIELSEILGTSVKTLRNWCSMRKIPFTKVGRLVKFDPVKVQTWLDRREVEVYRDFR